MTDPTMTGRPAPTLFLAGPPGFCASAVRTIEIVVSPSDPRNGPPPL